MASIEHCQICSFGGCETHLTVKDNTSYYLCICQRCGRFHIDSKTVHYWNICRDRSEDEERLIANASGWIYENPGVTIDIDRINKTLLLLRAPTVFERLDKLLVAYSKRASNNIGKEIDIPWPEMMGITWSFDVNEARYLFDKIKALNWIETALKGIKLTIEGWKRLDKVFYNNLDSNQGFIAMWFNPKTDEANSAIRDAIHTAGYKPHRVDDEEHTGRIDDKIIMEIRKSRFIVADFTGHRGGVYFEAGYALGLGIPVFWTCKKNSLRSLHFDIRQYNVVDWKDTQDLEERLANRIEAVLGRGNYRKPT